MSRLMDDLPPPPYTARDPHEADPLLPGVSEDLISFNAFVTPPVIPPPTGVVPRRPVGQPQYLPPIHSLEDLSSSGFVSAAPYFELRPFNGSRPSETGPHCLQIAASTNPESLMFPQPRDLWLRRGVDDQDWLTFINHLFPDRAVQGDANLVDDLDRLQLSQHENEKRLAGHFNSSRHPNPVRGNSASGNQVDPESTRLRYVRITAVCTQWNAGFFEPRGLRINLQFSDESTQYFNSIPRLSHEPEAAESPCLSRTRSASSGNVLRKPPPKTEAEESLLLQAVAKGKKSNVKKLLEDSTGDLEAVGKKGETALYRAVSKGEEKIAQMLLAKGADPLNRPIGANTPLYIAVSDERKGIVKLLLDSPDAGIEVLSEKGESPLYCAVRKDNKTLVELLLNARANPLSRPIGQESMLNRAIMQGSTSLVKLLLKHEVDIEEKNKDGDTPLCRCVSKGESTLAKLLLDRGADHTTRSSKGEAPLSIAVARGESSIVNALLARPGIDLEAENAKGETPLYSSISRGDTSTSSQLLVKSANPNAYPLASGDTMLNIAVSKGNFSIAHLLITHGAEVNQKNKAGDLPLYTAVSRGDTSIVALLLGKKADPELKGANNEPCLYKAVYRSDTSIVSLLLSHKANPDVRNSAGESCLYRAVSRGDSSITSLLLSHRADPHVRHTNAETPLYRAICRGDSTCVSLLLGNGAWSGDEVIVSGETVMQAAVRKGNSGIVQVLKAYVGQKSDCQKFLGMGRDMLGP